MFFSQNFLGVLKSYQSFCHVAITVCRTSVFYFGILVVVVFLEYFYSSTIFYPRSLCGQNITWILLGLFSDTTYFFGGKGISSLNVKMRAYKAMRVLAGVFFRFTLFFFFQVYSLCVLLLWSLDSNIKDKSKLVKTKCSLFIEL